MEPADRTAAKDLFGHAHLARRETSAWTRDLWRFTSGRPTGRRNIPSPFHERWRTPGARGAAAGRAGVPEGTAADQSAAALCKAEGANRVTTSNTKCITPHLLLTGIDGTHYPMKPLLLLWGGGRGHEGGGGPPREMLLGLLNHRGRLDSRAPLMVENPRELLLGQLRRLRPPNTFAR